MKWGSAATQGGLDSRFSEGDASDTHSLSRERRWGARAHIVWQQRRVRNSGPSASAGGRTSIDMLPEPAALRGAGPLPVDCFVLVYTFSLPLFSRAHNVSRALPRLSPRIIPRPGPGVC